MKRDRKYIFANGIPPKNKFIQALMYLKIPLAVPPFRYLVKKFLKYCSHDVEIIPGFLCFYGNIIAPKKAVLNDTFFLDYAPIYIGENTKFSFQNIVITSTHKRTDFNTVIAKPINIGKNVWITSRCIILPGVSIGDNSIIGAGSVVTSDIPANCLAVGNPAKPKKYFKKII